MRRACRPVRHHGHGHQEGTCAPLREGSGALSDVVPMQVQLLAELAYKCSMQQQMQAPTWFWHSCSGSLLAPCLHTWRLSARSMYSACMHATYLQCPDRNIYVQYHQITDELSQRNRPPQHGASLQVRMSVLCSCAVPDRPGRVRAHGSAPVTCQILYTRPRRRVRGGAHSAGHRCHTRCTVSARTCLRRQQCGQQSVSVCPMHLRVARRAAVQRVEEEALWSVRRGRPRLVRAGGLQQACARSGDWHALPHASAPRALRSARASLTGGSEACATCWSGAQAHREAAASTPPSCTTFLKLQGAPSTGGRALAAPRSCRHAGAGVGMAHTVHSPRLQRA